MFTHITISHLNLICQKHKNKNFCFLGNILLYIVELKQCQKFKKEKGLVFNCYVNNFCLNLGFYLRNKNLNLC